MENRLKLKDDRVTWRDIGGEVIALDLEGSSYLGINTTGTRLWELLANGTDAEELVRALLEQHDIDPERARRDVAAFVGDLQSRGLLHE